jgi:ubiquinone/menaquinone biosynthesis C-methylase UbiE
VKWLITLWWDLVRFGFRLLYNELAWTYDFVSWGVSLGNWRKWQRASIPHLKILAGGSVLELAHGTGDLQIEMHQAGIVTTGFDLSRTMGTIATRKLRRRGFDPVLVRGSAMQLPFAQETFDAVVSTFPAEFMIDPSTLQESWRILTPG